MITAQNNEESRICWKEDVTFVWSALKFAAQWFALAGVIGQFSYYNKQTNKQNKQKNQTNKQKIMVCIGNSNRPILLLQQLFCNLSSPLTSNATESDSSDFQNATL